jgi:sec-independent protein translocase protein TatA
MPALGAPELIIILLLVVIVFGVGKLPEIGGALGKGIKEFRSAADDQPKEKKTDSSSTKDSAA